MIYVEEGLPEEMNYRDGIYDYTAYINNKKMEIKLLKFVDN